MLRSYLLLALKVLARRKAFTAISLFGITFTLVVLTVASALLDHVFAAFPPEVNQERTLSVLHMRMKGEHGGYHGPLGYGLLDRYARGLPGVERMSIFSHPQTADSYVSGRRISSAVKRTDAEFWRILSFRFVEGGPFGEPEVAAGRRVAVVNETTRRRFFGDGPAVGRTLELAGSHFRVMGVVEDVPLLRLVPFSDVWIPVTAGRSDAYRQGLQGEFAAIFLARDRGSFATIKDEFRSRMKRVDTTGYEFPTIVALPETPFEGAARIVTARDEEESHPGRLLALIAGVALLFMSLPAVNLVNLSLSRILERAGEIGVRKAFGASSRALVGQFVVENVVLALLGGVLAFVASHLVLAGINASDVIPYARLALNPRVFLYGLLSSLVLGLVSGVYPAWRMSRLHPVEALRGGLR